MAPSGTSWVTVVTTVGPSFASSKDTFTVLVEGMSAVVGIRSWVSNRPLASGTAADGRLLAVDQRHRRFDHVEAVAFVILAGEVPATYHGFGADPSAGRGDGHLAGAGMVTIQRSRCGPCRVGYPDNCGLPSVVVAHWSGAGPPPRTSCRHCPHSHHRCR